MNDSGPINMTAVGLDSLVDPPSNAFFPPPTPGASLQTNESEVVAPETPMVLPSTNGTPHDVENINLSMMENMGYDGPDHTNQHLPTPVENITAAPLGSVLPQTPWGGHEDYDFPASVGAADEQATDETYEQYEERVLNKRAAQMYHIVKSKLDVDSSIGFSSMCTVRNSRKQVAQKFYTLLVLKKAQAVELVQNSSYDNIMVTKGPKFLTASL
jgi:cohesin complex subunit SCC1